MGIHFLFYNQVQRRLSLITSAVLLWR